MTNSKQPIYCLFEGYLYSENKDIASTIVLSEEDSTEKNIFYDAYPLNKYVHKSKNWPKVSFSFCLPALKDGAKASIYIYNSNFEKLFFDDISLYIR